MGLDYKGRGGWGRKGKPDITHKTVDGKLIKAVKPKPTKQQKSQKSLSGPFGNITAMRLGAASKANKKKKGWFGNRRDNLDLTNPVAAVADQFAQMVSETPEIAKEFLDDLHDIWHEIRGRGISKSRDEEVKDWKKIDNIDTAENTIRDFFYYKYPEGLLKGKEEKANLKYMLSKNKFLKRAFKALVDGGDIVQDNKGRWTWPALRKEKTR